MIYKKLSLLILFFATGLLTASAQKSPQDMDRFIDALMKKMTTEEKIGQLNLPVTGEITTGQAKSSDIAGKIKKGEVGGLFNLKGVEKIREVQKQAVEESRLGIPLLFGMDVIHGYETMFPIPLGLSCTWDMAGIEETAPPLPQTPPPLPSRKSQRRRYLMDVQSNGGYFARPALGTCIRR